MEQSTDVQHPKIIVDLILVNKCNVKLFIWYREEFRGGGNGIVVYTQY